MSYSIRTATEADAGALAALLALFARDPGLLPLSERALRGRLPGFVVAMEGPRLVGCAALRLHGPGCAEIASVCVNPQRRGRGLGAGLVAACERRAAREGLAETWVVTASPAWFERLGYVPFPERELPWRARLAKAWDAFAQPPSRWSAAARARFVFMRKRLNAPAASPT